MKIITKVETKTVPVLWEYRSDFYPGEKAVASLDLRGDYGSDFDCILYHFDLDNDTAREILEFLVLKLPRDKKIEDFQIELDFGI